MKTLLFLLVIICTAQAKDITGHWMSHDGTIIAFYPDDYYEVYKDSEIIQGKYTVYQKVIVFDDKAFIFKLDGNTLYLKDLSTKVKKIFYEIKRN